MEEKILRAYLRLCSDPAIGASRLAILLQQWGSLDGINAALQNQTANSKELQSVQEKLRSAASNPPWHCDSEVDRTLEWVQQAAHGLMPFESNDYPFLLRQIARPPPLLYLNGDSSLLQNAACAIVGSRAASQYGERHARWFAHDLANLGFTIVSGLARGIDAAAHRGALQAGGTTIAVLGTGIDRFYPRANQELGSEVAQSGLLVTEFPLGAPPRAEHFPQRNRIIAGLSLGTLVIEGGLRSGSLITARLSMEQGREVFALPGPVSNKNSRGCHKLVQEGASLVESPADVSTQLLENWHHPTSLPGKSASVINKEEAVMSGELSAMEQKIIEGLNEHSVLLDQLLQDTGLTVGALNAALLQLELKGLVSQNGGRVSRVEGVSQ